MLWGENRGKWKGRQLPGVEPMTPLAWAISALPLSHDSGMTTNSHNPLYVQSCICTWAKSEKTTRLVSFLMKRIFQSVDHLIQTLHLIPHAQALQSRWQQPRRMPLVTTITLDSPAKTKIIITISSLYMSPKLKQAIPNPPLVTFRCPKNFKELLVHWFWPHQPHHTH